MQNSVLLIVALSIVGGLFKIVGGIVYGSKSLFVDAMTSIANTFAIAVTIYYLKASTAPPDEDHPYGHHRLALGGPIVTIAAYSFVFGVALLDTIRAAGEPYTVSLYAPLMALLGFIAYTGAIAIAKKIGGVLVTYARFTVSELIESGTTIATSLGGAVFSYLIDFGGAIALLAYLFKELVANTREVIASISDIVPPEFLNMVRQELRAHGIKTKRIRIRRVLGDVYHGDVVIELPPDMTLAEAHRLADEIENKLRKTYGIDITIHLEPAKEH